MNKIALDFRRPVPASPWRWALMLAGVASLAAVAALDRQLDAGRERLNELAREVAASQPATPAANLDPAQVEAARQAVATARHPWNELFAALEKADGKDVALLRVAPDAANGEVRLHAEARNLAAMLAYHRRLESGSLTQVALVEHEAGRDGNGAVRFQIAARWGERHVAP